MKALAKLFCKYCYRWIRLCENPEIGPCHIALEFAQECEDLKKGTK